MAPAKQTAAIILETGGAVELRKIDVPKPGKGQALLKIVIAVLNPIDRKMANWAAAEGAFQKGKVSGCDVTGIVEELGEGAEAHLKIGDRVAGFIFGATQPTNGGFAEYCVVKADLCFPIPAGMSDESGAQVSIPILTACQTLYQSLGFALPPAPAAPAGTTVLVYGASSTVGAYNIQFAKLAGLRVITTASQKHFDLARRLGADEVYDYKDPESAKKIKEATGGKLIYAVDAISDYGSENFMSAAMADEGAKVATVRVIESPRKGLELIYSLAYDFLADRAAAGRSYLAEGPIYTEIGKKYLAEGKIQTMPWRVAEKGLASINDEFKNLAEGKISGEKVVFRISDTPDL